jgi:hypothetical protein
MARTTRKFVALAVIGAGLFGTYKLGAAVFGEEVAQVRLANQVWIERLPADDRDMIHHLVLVEDGSDRFGAFGKSSTWRHLIEVFVWKSSGQTLALDLPQDRKRVELGFKVSECEGKAPRGFQLCLELTNKNGRSATYYSRHDWRIDGTSPEALAALGEAQPEIAPLLEDLAERPAAFDASEFVLADDFIE